MKATDGGEVYSPNVGGKRFLKNKFFGLGGRAGVRRIGICLYAEKLVLALAGCRRGGHRRWRSVLFCREQRKSKIIMPKA